MIKSRAAVAFAAGQPLQVVELDVEPPRRGRKTPRIHHFEKDFQRRQIHADCSDILNYDLQFSRIVAENP